MGKQRAWSVSLDEPGQIKDIEALKWEGPALNAAAKTLLDTGKELAAEIVRSNALGSGPFHVAISGLAGETDDDADDREPHLYVNVVAARAE